MTNYANRGMTFESVIEYSLRRYRASGEAIIMKQHTKFIPIRNRRGVIVSCKVEEKSTVDFMGRYHSLPVAFEAKNTNTNRIRFDEVQPHQAHFLDEWGKGSSRQEGYQAFGMVVVSFNRLGQFYAIPWPFWKAARDAWENRSKEDETGSRKGNDGEGKENGHGSRLKREVMWSGVSWTTPGKASVSPEELLPEWEIKRDSRHGLALMKIIDSYITLY